MSLVLCAQPQFVHHSEITTKVQSAADKIQKQSSTKIQQGEHFFTNNKCLISYDTIYNPVLSLWFESEVVNFTWKKLTAGTVGPL